MTNDVHNVQVGQTINRWPRRVGSAIFLSCLILLIGLGALEALAQQPTQNVDWLRKMPHKQDVFPGELLTYTIIYTNPTTDTLQPTLEDRLPPELSFVRADPAPGDVATNALFWNLGALRPGQTQVVTLVTRVITPGTIGTIITNTARLRNGDAVLQQVQARNRITGTQPSPRPALRLIKRASITQAALGDEIGFTVFLSNTGETTASNVVIVDPIPAGSTYISGTVQASAGQVTPPTNQANEIRWQGDVGPNQGVIIRFNVTAGDPTGHCQPRIVNVANMTYEQQTMSADAVVNVECTTPTADLRIIKRANITEVAFGGTIEYTVWVSNTSNVSATDILVEDNIPTLTTYISGSVTASKPTVAYSSQFNHIRWVGDLGPNEGVMIKFQVMFGDNNTDPAQACIAVVIENKATLVYTNQTQTTPSVFVAIDCDDDPLPAGGDLGDAPDDTNHHGLPNTAYTLTNVAGKFPTVWDSGVAGDPSGPIHFSPNDVWLGDAVSLEEEADQGADADGLNNILANLADNADNDRADDGWLNPRLPLNNCRETTLKVRVSKTPFIDVAFPRMFLNVWFDGNRDGDWGDVGNCPTSQGDQTRRSSEWIVQNFVIDPNQFDASGDLIVPTGLILNDNPEAAAWMRFTLSEKPVPRPSNTVLPDGRGPTAPEGYTYGETEDYLVAGQQTGGEPGAIRIEKLAPEAIFRPGDVTTYTVLLTHEGGDAPLTTVMSDVLPAEVMFVRGPRVTEIISHVAPLIGSFEPGIGPSGAVFWRGALAPGAKIQLDYSVRVRRLVCPANQRILNVAGATQANGQPPAVAEAIVTVDCTPQSDPQINLVKRIVRVQPVDPTNNDSVVEDESTEADVVGGQELFYVLRLSSQTELTSSVQITDAMPAGIRAVGVRASSGVARILNEGRLVIWDGEISATARPVEIRLAIRLDDRNDDRVRCNQRFVNVAHWISGDDRGQSNPVAMTLACRDLGDAPDSTNHHGTGMTAYPGVPANFPTVFDSAPDRGPSHDNPRPAHLGRGVTLEREADQGFDTDGPNNIEPRPDRPDLDEQDDGLDRSELTFNHCQTARLPIWVSLSPAATTVLSETDGIGYLNVWVDSNRDGDWADALECPPVGDGPAIRATEHILIDYPVDANALGSGLHRIIAPTTGPVFWPADQATQPAWLRITLSGRPANKNLGDYGDGRGYDAPFRYGETEDYRLRLRDPNEEADATISKGGRLFLDRLEQATSPFTGDPIWRVNWVVTYKNNGFLPATNVQIVDRLLGRQTLINQVVYPPLTSTVTDNTVTYRVGQLNPGQPGHIALHTTLPLELTPGTVVTNVVEVSSDNDNNLTNNTATYTLTVPLLSPAIVSPIPGTTCSSDLTVTGKAQPGVMVQLYVDGDMTMTVTPNNQGNWQAALSLTDGSHEIYAVSVFNGRTSDPSAIVKVMVDSSLSWSPMSLRFRSDTGRVIIPRDDDGRLDETGWRVFLRPGHVYTVTVSVCCDDENAQVTLEIPSGEVVTVSDSGQTDGNGNRIFAGSFSIPETGRVVGDIKLCVTCDLIQRCSDGQVLIDPEGTVFDRRTRQPIVGATVACFEARPDETGRPNFSLWPADQFGQLNPQTTGEDGYYSFFTPPGTYQVRVRAEGYQPYRSPRLVVIDEPVKHNVYLTPRLTRTASHTVVINENGFDPSVLEIEPGQVVEWLNVGDSNHATQQQTDESEISVSQATAEWDSGLLASGDSYQVQFDEVGTYTYTDPENPANTATIIVEVKTEDELKIYLPVIMRQ